MANRENLHSGQLYSKISYYALLILSAEFAELGCVSVQRKCQLS